MLNRRTRRTSKLPAWLSQSYGFVEEQNEKGMAEASTQVESVLLGPYGTLTFTRDVSGMQSTQAISRRESVESVNSGSHIENKRKFLCTSVSRAALDFSHLASVPEAPTKHDQCSWSSSCSEDNDQGSFSCRPTKRFRQYCADNPFAAQAAAASLLAGAAWIEAVQALAAAKSLSGMSSKSSRRPDF